MIRVSDGVFKLDSLNKRYDNKRNIDMVLFDYKKMVYL